MKFIVRLKTEEEDQIDINLYDFSKQVELDIVNKVDEGYHLFLNSDECHSLGIQLINLANEINKLSKQ